MPPARLLKVGATADVPATVVFWKVPLLLMVPAPVMSVNELLTWMSKTPLLSRVELITRPTQHPPTVQIDVPALAQGRDSVLVAPVRVLVTPACVVSRPVPPSVPPLQAKLPPVATVMLPAPVSVPPATFRLPMVVVESSVAVPEEMNAMPGMLMLPPLAFSVMVPKLTVPPPVASELALNTMFSSPTVEPMPALRLMLLWAFSVSVAPVPAVLAMASATVMLPAWALVPPVPVLIMTLVPAFSAV